MLDPRLAALSALLLVIGLGWGFGFAPADYQQGESYRIMYLHVPAAMWSMGLYSAMAVAAFVGVVWQIKMADLAIAALAPVGAVCTTVALVSGAAWASRCGDPVDLGRPPDLRAGATVSVCRGHRPVARL